MRLQELFEGRVNQLYLDKGRFDDLPTKQPIKAIPANFFISINGRPWKRDGKIVTFPTHAAALRSATSIYNRNPKIKLEVLPNEKGP